MDDIKIVPRVSIPKVGMQSVRMPIVGNKMDSAIMSIFKDLKSHMIGWYDVKRQGCTNESLADNPVLEDLSGNNHPLELRNFVFGGLSGMGSYGTDLTKWTVGMGSIEYIEITPHKATVKFLNNVFNNFRIASDSKTPIHFKAKTNVRGQFHCVINNNSIKINSNEDGIFDVTLDKVYWVYFKPFNISEREYTIEILPSYPNSLVFNGVTPEYVINKDNVTLSNVATAVGVNKFKLTGNHYRAISYYITGKAGEPLTVSIPSFIVRVTGIESNSMVQVNYKDSTGNYTHMNLINDGTYIVPAINYTLDANEDGSAIKEEAIRMLTDGNIHDITLEFLPNYPAPTTRMYGAIPSLTQGAKCMMMDVTPLCLNPDANDPTLCLYSQRALYGNTYAVVIQNRKGEIAYNTLNSFGTYINGKLNNQFDVKDLTQIRQVISVNASVLEDLPNGIIVGCGESFKTRFNTMALNSLLLFDKELTEEEMKVVMDRIMKYRNVDGIDMLSAPDKIGFTVGEYNGGG